MTSAHTRSICTRSTRQPVQIEEANIRRYVRPQYEWKGCADCRAAIRKCKVLHTYARPQRPLIGMSARLQRPQRRSRRANLPNLREPGRRDRRAWAVVDGTVGRRSAPAGLAASACSPGKTGRRRGSSWPPSCPPASGAHARHPRQGHGRLTALLCRERAGYAGDVGGHLRFHFHGQLQASPDTGGLLCEIGRPIAVVRGIARPG